MAFKDAPTPLLWASYAPLHATILCAVIGWAEAAELPLPPKAREYDLFGSHHRLSEFVEVVERGLVRNVELNRKGIVERITGATAADLRFPESSWSNGVIADALSHRLPWTHKTLRANQEVLVDMVVDAIEERYPPHRDEQAVACLLAWYAAPR